MIDIAAGMAVQTQRIARRDVVELGEVELTDEEDARLGDALLHIEQVAEDLRRLRGLADRTVVARRHARWEGSDRPGRTMRDGARG